MDMTNVAQGTRHATPETPSEEKELNLQQRLGELQSRLEREMQNTIRTIKGADYYVTISVKHNTQCFVPVIVVESAACSPIFL